MDIRKPARIHAPGPPSFELYSLGWRAFQDLCAVVAREVWDQAAQPFADTLDAGRDGAFYGIWKDAASAPTLPDGPFVLQCKFIAQRDKTLTLSAVEDELAKIQKLVAQGVCGTYILMTNARVTGYSEQKIRQAILAAGAKEARILAGQWLNQTIALNQRLRMFVPRVYGLGDLSQILDERAYTQARALLDYLQEDLATFVVTDAYRRAARAVTEHGFCLLLGEPAVGKSVIAATLAMTALDNWGCLTIRADSPEDVITHWNPDEPNQFFWIDDAFGSVRHEPALTAEWARRMPKVMAAIKGGARVVLTSRDYIYRAARPSLKEYAYPLLREHQVVIDVAELSTQERQQIIYNHLRLGDQPKEFRTAVKPYLVSLADQRPFRPEVARRLGMQAFTENLRISASSIEEFMSMPNEFLQDIYSGLEPDHIGALALVYQSGELPVPLEVTSSERLELLTLVGSDPGRVAAALDVLEGTFLRRAQKVGSSDMDEYWSFRHPTLREGFAKFVASSANLLKLFIQGLDDDGVLTQLDCGSGVLQGTLVSVPSSLYRLVAERVKRTLPEPVWSDRRRWQLWTSFLATQCSRRFLELYDEVDPGYIERCMRLGSYLSAEPERRVLAKLQTLGLLSDDRRRRIIASVKDLAVQTPDAEWLDDDSFKAILSEEEREEILDHVRAELLSESEIYYMLSDWSSNEQGDNAEEYYQPLIDALETYKKAFARRGDQDMVRALTNALASAETQCNESETWNDTSGGASSSRGRYPTPFRPKTASDVSTSDRSIFDDVDQ